MRLALIQPRLAADDFRRNAATAVRLMDGAGRADLYLLPEMWATGFLTEPDETTARAAEAGLDFMRREAARRGACVAGSLAVPCGGGWRNRFFLALPDGSLPYYDKRHLFFPAGEDTHFTPGVRRVVARYEGVEILPEICFDLRFPENSRNRADTPYDLLLCCAGWPAERARAWDALLRARAVENLACCAGCNCCGTLRGVLYGGGSAVYSPAGECLARLGAEEGATIADIDMEALRSLRKAFPVLPTQPA
jgi:omega-amidase